MKRVVLSLIFAVLAIQLAGQPEKIFENRKAGLAFCATSQWQQVNTSDDKVLELVNPNGNLHVRLWADQTKLGAVQYLEKQFNSEGVSVFKGPFEIEINNYRATAIIGSCAERLTPRKVMLMAVEKTDGFWIIQFKCPEECFREHELQLKELINAVVLLNNNDGFSYLSAQRRPS